MHKYPARKKSVNGRCFYELSVGISVRQTCVILIKYAFDVIFTALPLRVRLIWQKVSQSEKGSQHSFDITQSFRLYSIRIGYVVIYKPFSEMKEECLMRLRRSITCVSRVIININCMDDMEKRYAIANSALSSRENGRNFEQHATYGNFSCISFFTLFSHLLFHSLLCVYLLGNIFPTFSIIHQTLPTIPRRNDCIWNENLADLAFRNGPNVRKIIMDMQYQLSNGIHKLWLILLQRSIYIPFTFRDFYCFLFSTFGRQHII